VIQGNNDYLNNYLIPEFYGTSFVYNPNKFDDILVENYKKYILVNLLSNLYSCWKFNEGITILILKIVGGRYCFSPKIKEFLKWYVKLKIFNHISTFEFVNLIIEIVSRSNVVKCF
jgi:hypothetical protein